MFLRSAAAILVATVPLFAAVAGLEVTSRLDAGPSYERVRGKVTFTVDPAHAANAIIHDLKFAEKNAQGLVEFAAEFEVLKPWDPAKGNGTLLVDIINRGNHTMAGTFDEKWLMAQGYTVACIGWQPDLPLNPNRLRLFSATAKGVSGITRSEYRPETRVTSMNLGDRDHLAYPVAPGDDKALKLTVRDSAFAAPNTIPRELWKLNAARTAIEFTHNGGFQPGKIYEIVYPARDPWIIGLGPAAIRDFVSFLKYGGQGHWLMADQTRFLKRSISFGSSQSGRFLRTFLYQGFNLDEKGKKIFDGVFANVAGAGRGSFNHRFAQPSRDGHPTFNFFYPSDVYPFTDLPVEDPIAGVKEGLLERAMSQNAVPKIFYTNGSYEYWGRAASLIHTTPDGKQDAAIAPDTRIYYIAGTQHGPGTFPPSKGDAQKNMRNSVNHRPILRALLADLNEWIKDGTAPPASTYPRTSQLVSIDRIKLPKGIEVPKRGQAAYRVDYGPRFKTEGIVDHDPPKLGQPFAPLVPQVDDDGNEIAGVKMPQVSVPLATYTGWNPAAPALGMPGDTYAMAGSTIPFPKAKILEKYGSKEKYLERVRAAVDDLKARRFLLEADAVKLVADAGVQWDWFMNLH